MPHTLQPEPPSRLGKLPSIAQWAMLIVTSLIVGILLHKGQVPAALLLGPMVVGIVMGTNNAGIRVPRLGFLAAQSVLGVMVGGSTGSGIVSSFANDWPLVIGVTTMTILASSFLGWLICVKKVLPGTVGIWGSSPGGASAMVIMAEAFGSDARLVAFMQYMRVVCVVSVASIVAHFAIGPDLAGQAAPAWFEPFDIGGFGLTVALALVCCVIGTVSRLPSGALLAPMIITTVLHVGGWFDVVLPEWFMGITYAMIGWTIGLKFTPQVLRHAASALPKILLSILCLIAFCAGISLLLVKFMGIDPLTAYLATSPGGLDSVAIIAANIHVDLPFILVTQTTRFFMVLLIGPPLARFMARLTAEEQFEES